MIVKEKQSNNNLQQRRHSFVAVVFLLQPRTLMQFIELTIYISRIINNINTIIDNIVVSETILATAFSNLFLLISNRYKIFNS